ncbi:hypothetical protein BLNAU_19117 [Blattamonas nauphoetae]|uniref:Uncharacterized protein n=1 Tax=Blattamonas nauphoetae TaxID=2049346 RepID=A0ABQ9X304_9EUKA|nr:hypothetical protein BLNAU_19117 [Blattamonas nauphoetae]
MKTATPSCAARSDLSSQVSFSIDTSPFLNCVEDGLASEHEKAVVFRSLVATLKSKHTLDASLEAKAVSFLKYVILWDEEVTEVFPSTLASSADESPTDFVQSIVELISLPSHTITDVTVEMLERLIFWCSVKNRFTLIKADLIPHLIITLNPLSLSFTDAVDIHINFMKSVSRFLWLATPGTQADLEIEGDNALQAVCETVLQQVIVPSDLYLWHLCANRFSIIDEDQSMLFLDLLHTLLHISSCYQPTMDFVLHMHVFLVIPSCLTFFENDETVWSIAYDMIGIQQKWNKERGEVRQMCKEVHQMLRMEGIEDVIEEKLQTDKHGSFGSAIVAFLIEWKNLLGMNNLEPK